MGKVDSKTRSMIIRVAEDMMLENGYAAVTSRKIAARANVSFQLVHYYFHSMDDLFLAMLDRSTDLYKRELRKIAKSSRPLTGLWEMNVRSRRSALSVQFMALAVHNEHVRVALKQFGDLFRDRQIAIIAQHLESRGGSQVGPPPEVLAVTIENIARMMVFSDAIDLSRGHRATADYVTSYLKELEGADV